MTRRFIITQGEYCVTDEPDATIGTVLGSCVACCLWDPVAGAGGMNHMLLTTRRGNQTDVPDFHGVNAMELLINNLLKLGARRERLRAKAFGGARMISGLSDIGPENSAFLLNFLQREDIPCVSHSLGGDQARQIIFKPHSGAVRVKIHARADVPEPVPVAPQSSDVELF